MKLRTKPVDITFLYTQQLKGQNLELYLNFYEAKIHLHRQSKNDEVVDLKFETVIVIFNQ